MTWWQALLTATAPALVTALALLAQQAISARSATAAARLEAASKWHDRRYDLVTECLGHMQRFERAIVDVPALDRKVDALRAKVAESPIGPEAWGLEEDLNNVLGEVAVHSDLLERILGLGTRLAFVLSDRAADRFDDYTRHANTFLEGFGTEGWSPAPRVRIAEDLAHARRAFVAQARVDAAAPATPRRPGVGAAWARLRRRAPTVPPSAADHPGSP